MSPISDIPDAPPRLILGLTEGARATSELAWFAATQRWLARGHRGEGRPVLVLPGLLADDASTRPLRRLLTDVGYATYPWDLGRDIGPTERIIAGLDRRLAAICDKHGAPVSVIGQSLGGLLGRDLARRHPGAVERIITLGSPVAISSPRQSRANRAYVRFADQHLPDYAFEAWSKAPQPPVPSTSIYSRCDGVVRWEACLLAEGPLTENIAVVGSHLGLAVQPAAVYAVLDRLETPIENWSAFVPPAYLRAYFPSACF